MNRSRTTALSGALALTALALVAGCAHHPAREAREADTELTSAHQHRDVARRDLEARQSQETYDARTRGAGPEEMQALQAKHQKELAELDAKTEGRVADAAEEDAEAHQRLAKDRAETRGKIERRLAELDGKAADARARSVNLDPARRSAFERNWATYQAEHHDVEGALQALSTSPDQEFPTWRDRADKQLDELDHAVDRLHEDVE